MISSRSAAVMLALLAAPFGGCSFLLAKPVAEPVHPGSYPECGTPTAALVYDIASGILAGYVTVASAVSQESGTVIVPAGAATAVYVASAVWGGTVRSRCAQAQAVALARLDLSPLRVPLQSEPAPAPPLPAPPDPAPPGDATPDAPSSDAAAKEHDAAPTPLAPRMWP